MKSTCNEVVVRRAVTARPDETVLCAAQRMRDEHVGDLVILEDERPAGIVTDRDLVVRVLASEGDPSSLRVEEVMTRAPATVSEDSDVLEVLETMRRTGARRMPVLGADGALIGILALDDVLAWLGRQMSAVGAVVTDDVRAERERVTSELAGQASG
jgi:CBS domain-containing protein